MEITMNKYGVSNKEKIRSRKLENADTTKACYIIIWINDGGHRVMHRFGYIFNTTEHPPAFVCNESFLPSKGKLKG